MARAPRNLSALVLAGIGLVLIGLLAGILVMLVTVNTWRPRATFSRPAEPVHLGSQTPRRYAEPPDSLLLEHLPSITLLNRTFKQVADHVTPAVVYIQVQVGSAPEAPQGWFHNFEEDEPDRFFREFPRQSVGSGVIISDQGHIVTNHHVVKGANQIRVILADKRRFEARVLGSDPSTDLAVLQVEDAAALPVATLGNSDDVEVGEWVLAVGNPFRLTSTVTAGIVSALGRQVNIIDDTFRIEDFIQTDAAINPGNSGGALVNLRGELVGISTAIATESGSYEGYGFAVPVNLMERVVGDLIRFGQVQRGYLGVEIREVDARIAGELGLERIRGVYINKVTRGGAASRGGVHQGDVILSIDGRGVDAPNELQSAIARRRPGEDVVLEIWRAGEQRTMYAELLGRDNPAYRNWFSEAEASRQPPPLPEREPETSNPNVLGLEDWGLGLRALTEREREAYGVEEGLYVAYVEHGGVAHQAGLPRGVVLTHVAGERVPAPEDIEDMTAWLAQRAERGEPLLFRVQRHDGLAAFYELDAPSVAVP